MLHIRRCAEMTVIYGEYQWSDRAAASHYTELFPMDRRPTHQSVATALCRLRDTSIVAPRSRSRRTRSNVPLTQDMQYNIGNLF